MKLSRDSSSVQMYSFRAALKLRGCVTQAGTDKPVPEGQTN
jgi:hypothetical protein